LFPNLVNVLLGAGFSELVNRFAICPDGFRVFPQSVEIPEVLVDGSVHFETALVAGGGWPLDFQPISLRKPERIDFPLFPLPHGEGSIEIVPDVLVDPLTSYRAEISEIK
jgi:hypothetical protein